MHRRIAARARGTHAQSFTSLSAPPLTKDTPSSAMSSAVTSSAEDSMMRIALQSAESQYVI